MNLKSKLFEKNMNRREFLGHIGGLMLMVVGISGVIRFFTEGGVSNKGSISGSNTYGSQPYGGTTAHKSIS